MSQCMHKITNRLWNLPLVSVAEVNGKAVGGGAELTTICDFRIVEPNACIQFVHARMVQN